MVNNKTGNWEKTVLLVAFLANLTAIIFSIYSGMKAREALEETVLARKHDFYLNKLLPLYVELKNINIEVQLINGRDFDTKMNKLLWRIYLIQDQWKALDGIVFTANTEQQIIIADPAKNILRSNLMWDKRKKELLTLLTQQLKVMASIVEQEQMRLKS